MLNFAKTIFIALLGCGLSACNTDLGQDTKKKNEETARGLSLGEGGEFTPGTPTPTPGEGDRQVTGTPSIDAVPEFILSTHDFTGDGEPGALIRVFVDEEFAAESNAGPDGRWTITVTGLPEKTISITAMATSPEKDASEKSDARSTTVDTTPPSVPVITGPGSPVTTAQPTVTGTTEGAIVVYIDFGAGNGVEVDVSPEGTWSHQFAAPLAEGEYEIRAQAVDAAGNLSGFSPVFSFEVDLDPEAEPPPAPGDATEAPVIDDLPLFVGSSVAVTGTASPGSNVRLFSGEEELGADIAGESGNWQIDVEGLPEGPAVLEAIAQSEGKEPSVRSTPVTVTVDGTAPDAPEIIDSGFEGEFPRVSGTGEPRAAVTVSLDGVGIGDAVVGDSGEWAYTFPFTLPAGVYTITAVASDEAGNVSVESEPFEFGIVEALPFP